MRSLFQFLAIFLLHFSGVRAQNSSMKLLEENRLDLPGISIRAIQVLDSSELWFAGSNGKIGRVKNGELLLDAWDDSLEEGIVGIVVGNKKSADGTEFRFNDFAITWP